MFVQIAKKKCKIIYIISRFLLLITTCTGVKTRLGNDHLPLFVLLVFFIKCKNNFSKLVFLFLVKHLFSFGEMAN